MVGSRVERCQAPFCGCMCFDHFWNTAFVVGLLYIVIIIIIIIIISERVPLCLRTRSFWAYSVFIFRVAVDNKRKFVPYTAAFPKLWSADHKWSSGSALVVHLD
jgi:hypothetical protein